MVGCFPCTFDFGNSNNMLYGVSTFFKYNFCLNPGEKPTVPGEFFFYISPWQFLNLVLIPAAKLIGHGVLGQGVFTINNTNIQTFILEMYKIKHKLSEKCLKDLFSATGQKMKFSIKDFFSKCEQIHKKLRIWSYLLKKCLMENFVFCAVCCKWQL